MAILYLFPTGNGDETKIGTPTGANYDWDCVDDHDKYGNPDPDNAETYIDMGYTIYWYRDLYLTQNHTTETGTINHVKIYFRCIIKSGGKGAKNSIKVGGTVYDYDPDDGEYTGTGIWETRCKTLTTNPSTDSAWTWSDIDECQCGVRVTCNSLTGQHTDCTLVYLEVDYNPDQLGSAAPLALTPAGTWERTFSATASNLSRTITYYFRAKAYTAAGWSYGEEKSFITRVPADFIASCMMGTKAMATRSGGEFTRTATLLRTGLGAAGRYIVGEWREALCAIGTIARGWRHDAHFYRSVFLKVGLRAVTFPMGPHRKLLLHLSAVKRFALDLWVAIDKCFHRWED